LFFLEQETKIAKLHFLYFSPSNFYFCYIWNINQYNFPINKKWISYNVNGIHEPYFNVNGIYRLSCGKYSNPDIICLEEIKATEDQIPVEDITKVIHTNITIQQPKGYSGVLYQGQTHNVVHGTEFTTWISREPPC
jgi:hypothetical protein